MTCVSCNGSGGECRTCGGRRHEWLTGCPIATVTEDVWEACYAAEMIDVCGWPLGTGWANESASLVSAVRRIKADEAIAAEAAREAAKRK